MQKLHDKIKAALDARPDLTQKGLAERMGLNPAAVNRMLHGQRNVMAEEIPVIEDYLGIRVFSDSPAPGAKARRGFAEGGGRQPALQPPIPVYKLEDKTPFDRKEPADWVQRHPGQGEGKDVFAICIFSRAMEPRYFRGEIAYIHPGRPAESGRDALIVPKKGAAFVARIVKESAGKIRIAEFSPLRERDLALKTLDCVHPVVGRS